MRYLAVHLTGPHQWDPSVLDYSYPSADGEPKWSTDPNEWFAFDLNMMNLGINNRKLCNAHFSSSLQLL